MTLAARLLLLIAAAVLPALLLLAYNEYDLRRALSTEVRQDVAESAEQATAWVRDTVEDAQRLSAIVSKLPEVRAATSSSGVSATCSELLVALRQDYPGRLEFGVANQDGVIVCTTRGAIPPMRVQGAHFRRAMESNAFAVGGYSVSSASGFRYLSFAYPIRDDAGQPIGAVLTGVDLAWLAEQARALLKTPHAVLSIHDRDLIFLARVPDEAGLVGKPPPPSVQALAQFANKGVIEATGADGLRRIGVINSLSFASSTPDIHVAVGVSHDAALQALNERTQRGLALLLLIGILAILAGVWGGQRFIQRPIDHLLAASRLWRQGDYRARVQLADRSSEFGRLATAYEEMADGLAQREAERSRAEHKLKGSEERLRLAQEAGGIGLWDWDLETDTVHRIGSVYRAWGLAEGQFEAAAFYKIVHPEDGERIRAQRAAALQPGAEPYEAEYRLVGSTGTVRWIWSRGEVIRDEHGKPVRMIGVNRDVTDRREALEALARINADLERQVDERTHEAREAMQRLFEAQKMESIGQLTGGVAHDFNNLLMATLGSLTLLRKRLPDDPKAHRLLENAIQGAERGALLTQRLLAFARRQELKPEAVDVPKLVDGMKDLLARSLGPSFLISVDFPEQLPPALVDAAQLELAILNLCINARDAMPDGGPIKIGARAEVLQPGDRAPGLQPGEYVCISVEDKGIGMDEATVARATEPFFTTKGVGKGTGLGLSMVAGLAAQSGGALRVSSHVGQGTTVEVWLRRAAGARAQSTDGEPISSSGTGAERPLVVLVVDDDALVAMGTSSMLEDMGHAVLVASSGMEALKVLRSGAHVDLVITDHAMPRLTGLELATAIREDWPNLPIILASGYAELPGGIDPALPRLSKPYRPDQLAKAISDAMGSDPCTLNVVPLRRP